MSKEQMLARATHVFVGVVRQQAFESWPFLRFNTAGEKVRDAKYWRVLRRDVVVEMVLRGNVSNKTVPVYEYSWTGGASGDWNNADDGTRALFLVLVENGRYHGFETGGAVSSPSRPAQELSCHWINLTHSGNESR
jgi:hypothetical protein